ncbi:hypothetical protein F4810DRAFT_663025 [Camillea tinctor]|nr:hypothetical protein F4810DRAFT_663025 [Camillea tinctor]
MSSMLTRGFRFLAYMITLTCTFLPTRLHLLGSTYQGILFYYLTDEIIPVFLIRLPLCYYHLLTQA